ncbi:MAG TPA: hypothetical protein DD391_08010 [Clostridiales bacterium]|nr:hypothetical protein [Clostridiales bacterium]
MLHGIYVLRSIQYRRLLAVHGKARPCICDAYKIREDATKIDSNHIKIFIHNPLAYSECKGEEINLPL